MPDSLIPSGHRLRCGARDLDLSYPQIMGVLNVTPDSFSDGGKFVSPQAAIAQAHRMVEEGASIIDIGGESTRPGAAQVTEQQELDRVVPVVEALAGEIDAVISVDTSTPSVMLESARAGAGLINDVRALSREGALKAAKNCQLPVCLMHMQGQPDSMQNNPTYNSVVDEVMGYLQRRVDVCVEQGISTDQLLIYPGFGFGKTLQHNLLLLKELGRFQAMGLPVLVGMSRKSMIGTLLDKPVDQRLFGSLAAAVIAVQKNARIIRVHDVGPTADAIKVAMAVAVEQDKESS